MTLDEILLQKLAKWKPEGRETLAVSGPEIGWTVNLTGGPVDRVGSSLWEVALCPEGAAKVLPDLKVRAERVADRVTGLLEPLRLVEVDAEQNVAMLRSDKPARRGDTMFYYELLLHGDGKAEVRRYQGPLQGENPRRQQINFNLTHDALAKLVSDLTAID
jgi:hypothetical protein